MLRDWQKQGVNGDQIWPWLTHAVEQLPIKQKEVFELNYFMENLKERKPD